MSGGKTAATVLRDAPGDESAAMIGACMSAMLANSHATSNALLAGVEAQRNAMAQAVIQAFKTLDSIPDHARSVVVDRLLFSLEPSYAEAVRCIKDPHPYSAARLDAGSGEQQ